MNDIYLSLKPIYEHYKKCGKSPHDYINRFIELYDGCYCFHVDKIVINSKLIIEDGEDINMVIDHEVTHHILCKYFGEVIDKQYDNISNGLEEYLWNDR